MKTIKNMLAVFLLCLTAGMYAKNNTGQADLDKGVAAYENKNFEAAFAHFSAAAKVGNTYAKNNLGLLYLLGEGVAQNYNEARKWLKEAAAEGYNKAIPLLWEMDKTVVAFLMMSPESLHDWEGSNGKFGFVDYDWGDIVIPTIYESGGLFSMVEGLAPAKLNGNWGFINWGNETVIPFQYEEADYMSFVKGLAAVKQNGKWGFIDPKGTVVVPFRYDKIELGAFVNGYAKVVRDNKTLYVDKTGKEITP